VLAGYPEVIRPRKKKKRKMQSKIILIFWLLLSTSVWSEDTNLNQGKIVPCNENSIRIKYSGPRYPQDTKWKIPLQIASGYIVGGIAAGSAVNFALDKSKNDDGSYTSGSHQLIFDFMAALIIGLPVFTLANPIPIYLIGNIGNEKSSIGFTFLGSLGGIIIPFIGGPIGATILNRSKRTYKYSCRDDAMDTGLKINLFEPKIAMGEKYNIKYQLDIIKLEL
jgi:hypothetical protein